MGKRAKWLPNPSRQLLKRRPAIPRHAARATRSAGRQMRSRLLDGASRLFKERGLAGTSISDIAAAADAFPSQITYYFRTKEALFVEAACRDMLYVARAAEQAALQAHTPRRIHARAGRDGHGDGFGRLLYRSADADPPPPGSRAAGRAHHRAAARRGDARLCRPDRTAWLEEPARSRRQFAAVLGGRDRRDGRGPCHGPIGRGYVRRDAARAGRPGDDKDRRRQRCAAASRRRRHAPGSIYPTGRDRHDRASHACPRLSERGSIDRRAPSA